MYFKSSHFIRSDDVRAEPINIFMRALCEFDTDKLGLNYFHTAVSWACLRFFAYTHTNHKLIEQGPLLNQNVSFFII